MPATSAPLDEFDSRSTAEHILREIRELGLKDVAGFIEIDADQIARAYAVAAAAALTALGVEPTQSGAVTAP